MAVPASAPTMLLCFGAEIPEPCTMAHAGVDYMHPDLGGGFGPGRRVEFGYDFVGDYAELNPDGSVTTYPDADPRDTCNGNPITSGAMRCLNPAASPRVLEGWASIRLMHH